ncbi:MAG TPA: YeeE/YedE thiosulfate transporter family protein [Candidatus Eisenbacteria bacterium]|nr:YeeE/YedE thiosulfate transporter family protein [Candidatus Eisenbacteria bacterium]
MDALMQPWPWYVAGPVIGLFPPALLLIGNKMFGISSNLRHICAACLPGGVEYFSYDWRGEGAWNLTFVLGVLIGGLLEGQFLSTHGAPSLSAAAVESLAALGIHDVTDLVPRELFSWHSLATVPGFVLIVGGGFLVGFGTAYAGGCTSGHAISGLADLQLPSLIAVMGFFAGGLISTWLILPRLLGG